MTMKEFYDTYNLNKYNFAEMAGVGTRSLIKFDQGEPLRISTRERIEKAVRVVEKYDLKRPEYDYGKGIRDSMWYRSRFYRSVIEYEERFKELLKQEEA